LLFNEAGVEFVAWTKCFAREEGLRIPHKGLCHGPPQAKH